MDKLKKAEEFGGKLIDGFHNAGLMIIGITIIWSGIFEYMRIMDNDAGYASLDDILLLFIYLELGAMIGMYFKTHKLPVVFLLFIGITALTRYLVFEMKAIGMVDVLFLVSAILVLVSSVVLLKFGDKTFGDGMDGE